MFIQIITLAKCQLLRKKICQIKVIILDVDGVLTDGSLFYGQEGQLFKSFNVHDGLGIRMLQSAGIHVIFLSGGSSLATTQRAKHLDVTHCLVGIKDKEQAIQKLVRDLKIDKDVIAYLGDDLNDLPAAKHVSLLFATRNATNSLQKKADIVLTKCGGEGAVRELADLILKKRKDLRSIYQYGWKDLNDPGTAIGTTKP